MTELNALAYCQSDVRLMLSIHQNDIQTVNNLLSYCKVDPDTLFRVTMSEMPAVMLCIDKGNYEIAKVFINNNCSVNRSDQNGQTSLMLAVKRQNVELVKLLIEKRASVNCSTFDNRNTALHFACTLSSVEIVQLLVENGADVNKKNLDGVTPLMLSCSFYRMDIIKYLLSTGKCDVNAVDNKQSSALIYATNSSVQLSKEMIQTLIEHGADVNHHDKDGCSVLNTLITSASESNLTGYELVSLLIDYGCDLEFKKSKFRALTPVHMSIFHNQDSITELFIRSGVNLNSMNINDEPVLLSLIKGNKTNLVRLAVEAGADLSFLTFKLEHYFRLNIRQLIDRVTDRELKDYLIDLFSTDYRMNSLKQLSRLTIRKHLGRKADQQIHLLNIPTHLKKYLQLKETAH